MPTKLDMAKWLSGARAEESAQQRPKLSLATGTAISDSVDGWVYVDLGGDTVSADGQQGVRIRTNVDVREGDSVSVTLDGAEGTATTPKVIGADGGGDRTREAVNQAASDASQAKDDAGAAKSDAAKAVAETKDLVTLRIDSSRGTVFKNSEVSTVLTVRCYKRGEEITTLTALRDAMGDQTARIRWYVLREGDTDWVSLADSDSMLSDDGFALTVNPSDVDIKCTFKAEIVTD